MTKFNKNQFRPFFWNLSTHLCLEKKIFKLRVYNIKNTLIFQRFKIINKESQLFSDVIYCKHEKYNINVTLKTQNYSLPPEKQHSGKGRVKKKYEFFVKKYENNREIFNYFFRWINNTLRIGIELYKIYRSWLNVFVYWPYKFLIFC